MHICVSKVKKFVLSDRVENCEDVFCFFFKDMTIKTENTGNYKLKDRGGKNTCNFQSQFYQWTVLERLIM